MQYEKDKIEKIQIQAARIVIETTQLISINALYNETQWKTLQQKRQNYQITLFYEMSNNLTPHQLSSLILSLSVLSHVITYGTLIIFRHWK